MAEHSDFKNYYVILGVSQEASAEEVKRAYRRLAKELHPDRHPDDHAATSKFQAVNEAHAVLSDPEARARYDAARIAPEMPNARRQGIDPIKCSSCGAVSAQPRYVIFWCVISLIFVTSRRSTVLSFYVAAGREVTINRVPEGTFIIEFATGRDFSPVCGYFLGNMSSRRFVNAESFETQVQGNHRYTSVLEITLNPVVGGTATRSAPIPPSSIAT